MSAANKHKPSARLADVARHTSTISRNQRELRNGHGGKVIWLTGLSGSGKSTIAHAVELNLYRDGFKVVVLDGDNLRLGLCSDLGFSIEDRNENVRRVGEVAKLFLEQGFVVLAALVSPMRSARDNVRKSFVDRDFIEVYCNCSLEVCRQRDPRGLYAKSASGMIDEFTGVSSPYEPPLHPELMVDSGSEGVNESVERVMKYLRRRLKVSKAEQ